MHRQSLSSYSFIAKMLKDAIVVSSFLNVLMTKIYSIGFSSVSPVELDPSKSHSGTITFFRGFGMRIWLITNYP